MTVTTTETPTAAAEVLAELDAAIDSIEAGQKAGDHAATAAAYERKLAAWQRLASTGYGVDEDDSHVLAMLLAHATSAVQMAALEGARQYRRWAAEQEAAGRSA
jgi:hypothetical protein